MPVYEYKCEPNGHRFEVRHGMNEASPAACPQCGGPIRRVILPVGIVFKGSGFYATDSRSTASTAAPAKTSEASSESGGGGETKEPVKTEAAATNASSGEAKTDAKSATPSGGSDTAK